MTPTADPDPLEDLRAQVRATQQAAERLMDGAVPPRGWEAPPERADAFGEEVRALAGLLEAVRELLPDDLREQVTDLLRQVLLVLRALIDWLVVRMDERAAERTAPGGAADAGEDIPIA